MNPIELLLSPDDVGQSEYRAIYSCIEDALWDAPEDERMEIAISMLEEFKVWAKGMRKTLKKASSKKAKSKGK